MTQVYRCTRNTPYQNRLVPERDRQGHYIEASTSTDALAQMLQAFPNDSHGFTIELWDFPEPPEPEEEFWDNWRTAPDPFETYLPQITSYWDNQG